MLEPLLASEKTLFSTCLEINRFAADWSHCDSLSNFLARSASLDRPDPFYFANLLSTILNELFESIFHHHSVHGEMTLSLRTSDAETILDATVPTDSNAAHFFETIARNLRDADPVELYEAHLLSAEPNDHSLGFYELVAVYGARIQIEPINPGSLRILMHVKIDETPQATA